MMALLGRKGRGIKGASPGSHGRSMHSVGEELVKAYTEQDWDIVLDWAYEFAPDLFEDEEEEE